MWFIGLGVSWLRYKGASGGSGLDGLGYTGLWIDVALCCEVQSYEP